MRFALLFVGQGSLSAVSEVTDNRDVLPLGEITRLQVQSSTLKLVSPPGSANPRYYDPAALLRVAQLELSALGVIGQGVVDVHNQLHPDTKNVKGKNGLSVGFTGHYARMRERFGPHLVNGIAGENVLVAVDGQIEVEQLADGLEIALRDGGRIHLERVVVAEPCVPFTRYALRLDPLESATEACTEGLRFLRSGMRGFYVSYTGEPVVLSVGDAVFARG